jgi:hypothetical protein
MNQHPSMLSIEDDEAERQALAAAIAAARTDPHRRCRTRWCGPRCSTISREPSGALRSFPSGLGSKRDARLVGAGAG